MLHLHHAVTAKSLLASNWLWPQSDIVHAVIGDLISAALGGLIVFLIRDHAMRLLVKWWRKHAGQPLSAELHERVTSMHSLVEELRAHLGNGYLDDVHAKLDGLEQKFRDVVNEDIVPLMVPVELVTPEETE